MISIYMGNLDHMRSAEEPTRCNGSRKLVCVFDTINVIAHIISTPPVLSPCTADAILGLNLQELVRIPYRRPKLLARLQIPEASRRAVLDLGAFNERLFGMTALPLRYFQGVALWLFKITTGLQVGQGAVDYQSTHINPNLADRDAG